MNIKRLLKEMYFLNQKGRDKFPAGWHMAFYTLWLGCFITGMGYSMTMPFISLFISDLGNYSKFEINLYSGLAFAMTFIAQAIVSPYWGSLADRKGRKLMCLRASGVMALTIIFALTLIIMFFYDGIKIIIKEGNRWTNYLSLGQIDFHS